MSSASDRFANAALRQAQNYDRKHRRHVPFSEIIDTLRRQAAFDLPLKFVLDRDPDSFTLFKRGPLWDFGNAGVRFEKKEGEGANPTLVVTWSDEFEQKTLQGVLDELKNLSFDEDASIGIELVSPANERMTSRYGNGLTVEKGGVIVHLTGSWQSR